MMIPSFDSSLLEYRRLYPLLAAQRRAYAVDVVGWGERLTSYHRPGADQNALLLHFRSFRCFTSGPFDSDAECACSWASALLYAVASAAC